VSTETPHRIETPADVADHTPLQGIGQAGDLLREVLSSMPSGRDNGPTGQQAREMAAALAEIARLANAHVAILSHAAVRGGAYRNSRLSSPAQTLASETGCTVKEAQQVFRVGKRAQDFPAVAAALRGGELVLSQADEITSALTMSPSDEVANELVALAGRRDAASLRHRCDAVRRNARGPLDHARARAKRNVRRWIDREGVSNLLLRTSSDDFIRIIATLDAEIDARVLGNRDPNLTPDMIAADALTDLICGYRMDRTAQRAEDVALFERLRRSARSFRDGDRPHPNAEHPNAEHPMPESPDAAAHHGDPVDCGPADGGTARDPDGVTLPRHPCTADVETELAPQVDEVFAGWDDVAWWEKIAAADPDAEYAATVWTDTDGSTVHEYPDGRFERFTAEGQLALLRLPKPDTDQRTSHQRGSPSPGLTHEERIDRLALAIATGAPPRNTAPNYTAPPDTPWSESRRHDWLPNPANDYARLGPEPEPDSHGWGACPTCGHHHEPDVMWRRAARAKAIIRVDATALARGAAAEGETVDLAGYGPIPIEALRSVLSDAVIAIMVTDGNDVRNVTHLSRKHTAAQSTVLEWLIGNRCSVPGCQNRRQIAWDHINEWATEHTTTIDDTQGQCYFHHSRKPEGHDFRTDPASPGHLPGRTPGRSPARTDPPPEPG